MAPIVGRSWIQGGRDGAIAQLGERVVRNDEVGGSIPPGSTTLRLRLRVAQPRSRRRSVPGIAQRATTGRRRRRISFPLLVRPWCVPATREHQCGTFTSSAALILRSRNTPAQRKI